MSNDMDPLNLPHVTQTAWPRHAEGTYPILVCVQFDETGHNALTMALRFAELQPRSVLQIVHVVADADFSGRRAVIARHDNALDVATAKLKEFVAARAADRSVEVKLHVRIGDVVENVLQMAMDYDVELIVVGTHGRSGVRRFALGSVAQKLVEAARCPMLVATPRDFTGMELSPRPDPPKP